VLAGLDVCPHAVSGGLRKGGGRVSQPDGDGGPVVDDVVDSEADDAGDGLRVEENECGGGPGPQGHGVVVDKANRMRRGRVGGRPPAFDRDLCKARNVVECCFNRLKQFRAIATRFDKLASG
jgi:hypothetical protein